MAMNEPGLAYAQTRLQARYGQWPDTALWRRLESITALSHFLQTARDTGLRPWLLNIALPSDCHAMETALRRQLRQHIGEVTRWLPIPWRPAAAWCGVLPDLPALQHLLGGGSAAAWLRYDEHLQPFTHDLLTMRVSALRDSRYAPLLQEGEEGADIAAAWAAHWRALWPKETSSHERAALDKLAALLDDYYTALRSERIQDSGRPREVLEQGLRRGFRRYPRQAATAFFYLALVGLSAERLRGALVRLILFPSVAPEPTASPATE